MTASLIFLGKVGSKANMLRMKFETEAVAKIEEHESARVKLQARLNEAESTMENLNNKFVILEKTKFSHEKNTEEAKYRVNQSAAKHSQAEKKVKVKYFNPGPASKAPSCRAALGGSRSC